MSMIRAGDPSKGRIRSASPHSNIAAASVRLAPAVGNLGSENENAWTGSTPRTKGAGAVSGLRLPLGERTSNVEQDGAGAIPFQADCQNGVRMLRRKEARDESGSARGGPPSPTAQEQAGRGGREQADGAGLWGGDADEFNGAVAAARQEV